MKLKQTIIFLFIIISITLFANTDRYTIQIGDTLEIFNYGYPDLTQTAQVGPDGFLEIKLIGSVNAVGKTAEELSAIIEGEFKQYARESRITVIVKERSPKLIYAMGELNNPQTIDVLLKNEITLLEVLGLCGGPTEEADLSAVAVMRNGHTMSRDISQAFSSGNFENNELLKAGDMIIVPKKYNRRVYLFGNSDKSGPVYFEEKEPMTLNYFLSKMSFNKETMKPTIKIHRDGEKLSFDALFVLENHERINLKTNDIIVVEMVEDRFCYVTGKLESGKVDFEKDEKMTLRTLMGKLGVDMKYLPDLEILHADGSREHFDSKRLATYDYELLTGDIIQFPISKYLYLIGDASEKGRIAFEDYEDLTLLNLLVKVGYQLEKPTDITIIEPDGASSVISTANLLTRDVYLKTGSIIQLPMERFVYLMGDIDTINSKDDQGGVLTTNASNRFVFRYDESMTLKTVIKRMNAIPVEQGINVTILRGLEQFQYDAKEVFYSQRDVDLKIGDTLVFQKDRDRFVYVLQEDNQLSKVYFDANEPMDLFNLFLKIGTISETWNDEVRIMFSSGDIQITDIDTVLSKQENIMLESKCMVMLPETYRKVYCFGAIENQGEILFERGEDFTLQQLLIKVQTDFETLDEIIIKTDHMINRYNPETFTGLDENLSLETDSIIYFKPYLPKTASIIGKVAQPGVKTFAKNEPLNLLMLLSKAGGFTSESDQSLTVIKPSGEQLMIDYKNYENPAMIHIDDGSYVIAGENLDDYVVLLGDVKEPGIKYLINEKEPLLDILSRSGGVLDWDENTLIQLKRKNGDSELINTEKDPMALRQVMVEIGDVVYVMPSDRLKIYVFGEVNRPQILKYYEGMTLFEAVLSSGGPKESAYLKKILYYQGGIDSYPQIVDLSNIKWSEPTQQILLQPGDVIYVPKSALVDILRVTGFIGSMITFSSNALDVYETMIQSDF